MPRITRQQVSYSIGPKLQAGEPIPPIEFEEPEPPINICDQVLGSYLRTWGHVEQELAELFALLLGSHPIAARIIISSTINARTLREITGLLADQRLNRRDRQKWTALETRSSRATTKRNHIVHGTWRLSIKVGGTGPNTATWERFYEPNDPRLYEHKGKPDKSQKVMAAHIFSIKRLIELTADADRLAKDLRTFTASLSPAPFRDMQHVKFSP